MGISPSYLNLIEHNRRRIGGKLLADLARALETEVPALSEGAQAALVDALARAAAGSERSGPGMAAADRFAEAYPGWAALVVAQDRRIAALERSVAGLSDRLAHDPFLSAQIHEVLSTVTAIRSTSAILAGEDDLDAEWRARFHRNLAEDSRRLASGAEGLARYLDAAGEAGRPLTAPLEEMEAWLARRGFHLPAIEAGGDPGRDLARDAPETEAGRALLAGWLGRYAEDAAALPLPRLREALSRCGLDPFAVADATGAPLDLVLRRLGCLPEAVAGGPVGLALCDGAGVLTFRRPAPGFDLPLLGGACSLWTLYEALSAPGRPMRAALRQAGRMRRPVMSWAVAQARPAHGAAGPMVTEATMLVVPADLAAGPAPGEPRDAGISCRICPLERCAARREPSILSAGS